MLSIIISSYQQFYFDRLSENIKETIGNIEFEIIQIWNPNIMSITEAYERGFSTSKYDNLLFIHEDVLFHTTHWGIRLNKHLEKQNTGIIGIAGSAYVPSAPSSWTISNDYNKINILQNSKTEEQRSVQNNLTQNLNKVFAVDGVFMAITKTNYKEFLFDTSLKGFHGYDLDFSLRVSKKYQNYVINDILIEHFSEGNQDEKWLNTNIKIREKLGCNFPHIKNSKTEKKTMLSFLDQYFMYNNVNLKNMLYTLRFHPLTKLNFMDQVEILKKYLRYIRYSNQINKRNSKLLKN